MGNRLLILLFLVLTTHFVVAQDRVITGQVTDDTGMGVPGVNVLLKGTSVGVATDVEGNYSLRIPAEGGTLVFSFIGYKTVEESVAGRSVINVTLQDDVIALQEVVVVGYGTLRKSDMTGSVASIKSEELVKVPSADPVSALQGKVAGLQILSGSGEPGSENFVRLRGINTLNNNNVLFVVDGVIIEGGINFLNPQDIESIEVLKDASAKAIFGTRGANGVVIVTTKKGSGEATFNFSSELGFESVQNPLDLMSGPEFANFYNDVEPGTYNNIDALPNTDWQELVFNDLQPIHNYTLSASGSTEKLNYYISGGYFNQEGIVPKSQFERITLKLNTSYDVKENITIGTSLTGVNTDRENAPGVINPVYWAWPIRSPFNPDGSYAEVEGAGNPLAAIEFTNSNTRGLRLIGNVFGEIEIIKDLSFKTSYQFNLSNNKSRSFVPEYFVSPTQQQEENILTVGFNESRSWIFENTISYNKEFDRHRINAVVGYSAQEDNFEFLNGTRENLLGEDPNLWYLNAGSPVDQRTFNGADTRALTSILFRANYVLDDTYLFTATFRRDGSSSFGRNNRYANFPAFAVGWNIYNESFFPKEGPLNILKFRASWGINGNQNIPFLDQFSTIGAGVDAVFGVDEAINPGATFVGQPGNTNLRWEETTEINVGFEFGLYNDKLTGEIDYYNRLTDDILVNLDLPGYFGAGAFVQQRFNAANVRNSGIDFILNWRDTKGDFTYGLGINGSTVNNTVESLGEGIPGAGEQITSGDLGNGQRVTRTEAGTPIGYFYGYRVIGVFQNADELNEFPSLSQSRVGDLRYEDINNDGVINADDRTFIGSWIPDFVYGFSMNVGYKGISLSLDFAGQTGNEIYNGKQAIRFATLNFEDRFLNRWTGPGTSDTDPRATFSGINYLPSDYFVEDASFLKLRTVTLSYDLNQAVLERLKLQSMSVFLRGTNLFVWTDYTGYTPELAGGVSAIAGIIDLGVYPTTRVISGGVNFRF